ncbi:MAG: transposase [Spirosomataceae bacterium]
MGLCKQGGVFYYDMHQKSGTFLWRMSRRDDEVINHGAIVQGFWFEIPKHFPNIQLGEFVVMPNHIHGILVLDNNVETLHCNVSTDTDDTNKSKFHQRISPKSGSISAIIRSYKAICTKHIQAIFPDKSFGWQERFWDHIIRDERSLGTIAEYIVGNPSKWDQDKFYDR